MLSASRIANQPIRRLLSGIKVLVVDNDCDGRDALVTTLEFLGARVNAAGSSAGARHSLETTLPDVIFCDIALPGEDGCAFVSTLKRDSRAVSTIPAAAVTTHHANEVRQRALESGFAMVVPKPFDLISIARAVLLLCGSVAEQLGVASAPH